MNLGISKMGLFVAVLYGSIKFMLVGTNADWIDDGLTGRGGIIFRGGMLSCLLVGSECVGSPGYYVVRHLKRNCKIRLCPARPLHSSRLAEMFFASIVRSIYSTWVWLPCTSHIHWHESDENIFHRAAAAVDDRVFSYALSTLPFLRHSTGQRAISELRRPR